MHSITEMSSDIMIRYNVSVLCTVYQMKSKNDNQWMQLPRFIPNTSAIYTLNTEHFKLI